MPYLMAGSMIAGGVLGGFSGSSEARNKYNAEMAAYNDRTIRETIAHSKQLFGIANANATKQVQNMLNAEAMSRNYARERLNFQKTTEDRRQFMAENQRLTEASTNSMVTAKLGSSSGTAERIREQMKHKGAKNWQTEFFNTLDAEKAMETQYRNNLNQIDDSMQQADAYVPGMPPQQPDMSMAILNGVMSGVMGGGMLGSALGGAFGGGAATSPSSSGSSGGSGGGFQLGGLSGGYGVSGVGPTNIGGFGNMQL
tara:strand:+ start:2518 stop:3282 length:765 start_codon:yes stop_codon:yes gene_type:complete